MTLATMTANPKQTSGSAESDKPSQLTGVSQGVICMWHGLGVSGALRMLRHRPAAAWWHAARWATIAPVSLLNSIHNAAESLLYGRRIARTRIEHPPVFILGHWRSGTTLFHNLMTLDPGVTCPNLYHCMNPGHFLLTERYIAPLTEWVLPRTRPMDNIPTSWQMPQEDEIALAIDCGISPYLMLALHMRPEVYGRYFDPREMSVDERSRWKTSLLRLMKKLTIRNNLPIVMKSPSHTFRIPILLEMFPDARFVYLYRDPYAVHKSTLHLRNTTFVDNALGRPNLEGNEEEMLHFYEKCIRTYEDTKSLVPKGHLHEVRFEELEVDPLGELAQTYKALDLPGWSALEPRIRARLPEHSAYRKNAFRMDRETMERVYSRLKWVFELYGYSSRLEQLETGRV
jgi:omega-hydroxy-beta-dihydromenaquinone-9 sulfotransferase